MRGSGVLRGLVRETRLSADALIYPIFVEDGSVDKSPIPSMPGQYRWSLGTLPGLTRSLSTQGIRSVLLFGLPATKDEVGSGAFDRHGIVQNAVRVIKDTDPSMLIITDTCLDEYTSHGHCGVLRDGHVDNDATLELLSRVAVSQADAGTDMVAPSDMMDGRVGFLRRALDSSGHSMVPIMAYSAKYASAFYGPFREAANCAPQFGDRRSYQMDPGNRLEALREVDLDVAEGADVIMVKPALAYLDIIREVRSRYDMPLAAYNVSGEYALIKAGVAQGWVDEDAMIMEVLTSIARAGANIIITYHACQAARILHSL